MIERSTRGPWMVFDPYARTVSRLGRLLAGDGIETLPDGELLRRYAAVRDEAAFAVLVRRHGPLVFGVCRRVLAHQQDAEDAFQATFLVLARRAGGVRGGTLGRWLYGVAVRVANKARARRAKRKLGVVDLDLVPAAPGRLPLDWLPHLDTALGKLSDRDRRPILLCDLQGRTRAEAAAELGIAEGTLSSRLARAREKLRHKLGRLSVSLSAAGLATGLAESAAGTVLPALIETTFAAGTTAAAARDLAEGVMRSMALATLMKWTALAGCLVAAGIVLVPGAGAEQTPTTKDAPKADVKAAPKPDAERIQGTWVVERVEGKKMSDAVPSLTVFEGNRIASAWLPGREKTFRLDPTKPVKHIDLELNDVPAGLKREKWVFEGVYAFVGDELHLGLGNLDKGTRPKALEGKDSGLERRIVLRRPTDLDRLQGHWVLNRGVEQPNPILRGMDVREAEFTVTDNAGTKLFRATGTLDSSKAPKELDLKLVDSWSGLLPGTVLRAIYDLDGDDLAVAVGLDARPKNFRPAERVLVTVYERGGRAIKVQPLNPEDVEGVRAKPREGPVVKSGSAIRIRQLQEERVKALRVQMEGQFERVKIGKDPVIQFIDAGFELCDAELAIADAREAKLAARETCFKQLAWAEGQLKEMWDVGLMTKYGVAQMRAARLKAEIELEKLKTEK